MKALRLGVALGFVFLFLAQAPPSSKRVDLPTSKLLSTPAPGLIGPLNSFPATIAVSPDGRYAALLNDGYGTQQTRAHQSIAVLDLSTNELTDFPDERLGEDAHQSYFLGLEFSSDGKHLYASVGSITDPTGEKPGDTGNGIAVYSWQNGKLAPERFLKIPPQEVAGGKQISSGLFKLRAGAAIPYPAGLAVVRGSRGDQLLVANNFSDNVVLLEPGSGRILKRFDLSTNHLVPSSFPYTIVASRDGRRAWCSLWNASQVAELDLEAGKVIRRIPLLRPGDATAPGSHPTAMALAPDEKLLYVALSNSDSVAAISTASGELIHVSSTRVPGQEYAGAIPNALAISADGDRLYVADAGINAIAVFDLAKRSVNKKSSAVEALGFIPTDWYPSALAVHGDDLLVATAKGTGTGPNNGKDEVGSTTWRRDHPYIATLLRGSLARLNYRRAEQNLADLTGQVEEENLLHSDPGKIVFRNESNRIRHVIYVIKENRTYDQILGDLKVGDGDRSLTMYGEDVTPNEHKLALQFGVLDNFYDSGEVSGDGHNWSTAAITSDYNEKTWQITYRGKERTYDFQGVVADEYAFDHDEADINDPQTGFVWDNLVHHGVSFRDYGEFINGEWCSEKAGKSKSPKQGTPHGVVHQCPRDAVAQGEPLPANVGMPHGGPSPWPWKVPLVQRLVATKSALRDHFDPLYVDFNTSYPDQLRADEFLNEFQQFVDARKNGKGSELPQFVLLYLPDDHTAGTRPGSPRPAASVADNDLALGRVVEAVSHSPYWDDTAIFVVEDDAQNGADHVDAHRSTAFVISRYSPASAEQPYVAHQFYTTVNLIHSMEELLGLPPMNQNDAHAPVMAPLFAGDGNQQPFNADWRNRNNGLIYEMNPPHGPGAKESSQMDFSRPDAANAAALNAILWRDRKGDQPMPAPRNSNQLRDR
ncbi:MAG TPA: beta-propeller fold lactonase family protein [Terriglobales bacterium]